MQKLQEIQVRDVKQVQKVRKVQEGQVVQDDLVLFGISKKHDPPNTPHSPFVGGMVVVDEEIGSALPTQSGPFAHDVQHENVQKVQKYQVILDDLMTDGISGKQDPPKLHELLQEVSGEGEKKQWLGELLFPLVRAMAPTFNGNKITGMLLELDNDKILLLLENDSALNENVEEAIQVLQDYNLQQQNAACATA